MIRWGLNANGWAVAPGQIVQEDIPSRSLGLRGWWAAGVLGLFVWGIAEFAAMSTAQLEALHLNPPDTASPAPEEPAKSLGKQLVAATKKAKEAVENRNLHYIDGTEKFSISKERGLDREARALKSPQYLREPWESNPTPCQTWLVAGAPVRDAPRAGATMVGFISSKVAATILGRDGPWVKIRTAGATAKSITGYVLIVFVNGFVQAAPENSTDCLKAGEP
jgi:hypothetical protein